MCIKSFYGVKVCAFIVVAQYLHGVFYGSKCMGSLRYGANFDELLLVLKALKHSLYLLQKFLTLWPTYAFRQSVHVNLHMQLAKYLLEI
jgi:hypothetical protein